MKATIREAWLAAQAVGELCAQPWPVKTSYGLAKLSRKLREQAQDVEAVRVGLVRQHGEADERGIYSVKESNPNHVAFVAAWNELTEPEIEIDWGPVPLPDPETLPNPKAISVRPAALLQMGPFISFEEDPQPAGKAPA